jgi:hypothetical protein
MKMGIKAISYENLQEGDLITWYGVHVIRWEDEIRPYGIEPTIAFVKDDTQDGLIKQLLAALEDVEWDRDDQCLWCGGIFKWGHEPDCKRQQALAAAKEYTNDSG